MHPNETGIYMALLSGVIILVTVMAFFFINIIRYQTKKTAFHKEKMKAQFHILDVERKRIAADLHDDIGASLSYIKLQLQGVSGAAPADNAEIERSEMHLEEVMQKIRRISFNMMPRLLQRHGLESALEDLLDMMTHKTGMTVTFQYTVTECNMDVSLHLYRIAQELLNNTLKHAAATAIKLIVSGNSRNISLHYTDNGKGFNKEAVVQNHEGLGVHSIVERVHILKGKIYLTTALNKGTDYLIQIPHDTEQNKSTDR